MDEDSKDMILSVVRQLLNQANVILQLHDRITKLEACGEGRMEEGGNPPPFMLKKGGCCPKCGSEKVVRNWWGDEDKWYCYDCRVDIKKGVK